MAVIKCAVLTVFLLTLYGYVRPVTMETLLACPEIPDDQVGACIKECEDDSVCQSREKCCPNDPCGFVCMPAEVTEVASASRSRKSGTGLFAISDVAVVLIGMGVMIFLLFMTAIITLCFYGGARERGDDLSHLDPPTQDALAKY